MPNLTQAMGKKTPNVFWSLHLSMITSLSGTTILLCLCQTCSAGCFVGGDEFVYHGHWSWHPLSMFSQCFLFLAGWCVHTGACLSAYWCLRPKSTTYGLTSITTSWATRFSQLGAPHSPQHIEQHLHWLFGGFMMRQLYCVTDRNQTHHHLKKTLKSKPWWILNFYLFRPMPVALKPTLKYRKTPFPAGNPSSMVVFPLHIWTQKLDLSVD